MSISREQAKRIAELSCLSFKEAELDLMAKHLSAILGYVEKISQLNIDGVEPFVHPVEEFNVFRSDKPFESISREDALKNAPQTIDGFFAVPPVIEEA